MNAGNEKEVQKIKVAIIGAGRVGVGLSEDLLNSSEATYIQSGFIDVNQKLDKTDNSMIFGERDTPLNADEIKNKLKMLQDACDTGDDQIAKEVLRKVVPTFKKTEEVNEKITSLGEVKEQKKKGMK